MSKELKIFTLGRYIQMNSKFSDSWQVMVRTRKTSSRSSASEKNDDQDYDRHDHRENEPRRRKLPLAYKCEKNAHERMEGNGISGMGETREYYVNHMAKSK